MSDEEIISIAVKTSLLNYIDNETPRRFFVSGHAELDDVVSFGRIIAETAFEKASIVIRAEVLEEAAGVADQAEATDRQAAREPNDAEELAAFMRGAFKSRNIAAAIRALKENSDA